MRDTKVQRRFGHVVVVTTIAIGTALGAGGTLGCRVNETDVQRWGTTQHGPDKLVAVITHDKYEVELRGRAALELIQMRPRQGRRIGIPRLTEALGSLSTTERRQIVEGLLPILLEEMKRKPSSEPNQPAQLDPSVPYKDAAFALLTDDRATLIADESARKLVTQALVDWSVTDFDRRLIAPGQTYSMEQVMRALGAPAVAPLPNLIDGEDSKFDRIASLIAELGDQKAKDDAAEKLVALATSVGSKAWFDKTKPQIEAANKASDIKVTEAQLTAQVTQYQDESLTRVFGALKKIQARAATDFCLGFAADSSQSESRRLAAVAALEGRLDRNQPKDVERILALATASDTPDSVRDLAFARVGEMPREQVVDKLYGLFGTSPWRVRAVSAQTVLKMSNPTHIGEFMAKLPQGSASGFAISEPLYYGQALADMQPREGKTAREALLPFLDSGNTAAKLTALGYFYVAGTANDIPLVSKLSADRTPTPKVDDDDAKWHCDVQKSPEESETVSVSTIGEFVRLCVEPQMKTRT